MAMAVHMDMGMDIRMGIPTAMARPTPLTLVTATASTRPARRRNPPACPAC